MNLMMDFGTYKFCTRGRGGFFSGWIEAEVKNKNTILLDLLDDKDLKQSGNTPELILGIEEVEDEDGDLICEEVVRS